MNTTRLGKIARLPRFIRQQLNVHLEDGMAGEKLLDWVNGLPETQDMLAEQFDGKPINKQNLSDWRLGGHQDWVRAREDCELAASLAERAQELGEAAEEKPNLSDGLGMILALHLARQIKAWQLDGSEPKERWPQLREMLRELAVLRREDHRAQRNKIAQEKWDWQSDALRDEKQAKFREAAESAAILRNAVAAVDAEAHADAQKKNARKSKGRNAVKVRTPKPKGKQSKSPSLPSVASFPFVPSVSSIPSELDSAACALEATQPEPRQSSPVKPSQAFEFCAASQNGARLCPKDQPQHVANIEPLQTSACPADAGASRTPAAPDSPDAGEQTFPT